MENVLGEGTVEILLTVGNVPQLGWWVCGDF